MYKYLTSQKAIIEANKDNVLDIEDRVIALESGGVATGDMKKSIYDTNNNGIVDSSESSLIQVRNNTGATLPKGIVLMATGALGASSIITVDVADGIFGNESRVLGIALEDILADEDGLCVEFGKMRNINTSAWNDGDILYVTPNDGGLLTNITPQYDELSLPIAIVVSSGNNGSIFIRMTNSNDNKYYFDFLELRTNEIYNVNTDTSLTLDINTFFVDASNNDIVLTLSSALNNSGIQYNIKRIDNSKNKVNIITVNSETIDTYSDVTIPKLGSIKLISNDTNWFII